MSKPTLSLSRADEGTPLSREEFAEAEYEEPWRYERVEGRLAVMTPSGHEHSIIANKLRSYLGAYELERPDVVAHVISEGWIAVEEETDRIADIAVYLVSSEGGRIPERIPDLVLEVFSEDSRRRDYDEKRAEYERIGIKEYVVVDRFEHRVTVFRLAGGQFQESALSATDTYTTPLLPGLEIPLEQVLREDSH